MSHTKTIDDLMHALTASMSEREIAKSLIKADISGAITNARMSENLSQSALAEKLGKTQGTISKWEAGDANFTVDLLVDIAADLGLDLTIKLKKPAPAVSHPERPSYQSTSAKIYYFPTYSSCDDNDEIEEM